MKLRVTVEGKTYEVDVEIVGEQPPAGAPAPSSSAQFAPRPAATAPPPPSAAPAAPKAASGGGKTFPSPLAGTVRTIHVKPGDTVELDQEVMILEAMKMETSVSASAAGTIKAVLVNVGDAVTSGQPLFEFE
jgi:glutaconyl-CoA/methylmalonyl-CoA decarboxylase subunit gamma